MPQFVRPPPPGSVLASNPNARVDIVDEDDSDDEARAAEASRNLDRPPGALAAAYLKRRDPPADPAPH